MLRPAFVALWVTAGLSGCGADSAVELSPAVRPARRCAGQHRWCCGAATCFGPRENLKPRMGATVHTVPFIVPGKRDVPLNYHGSRVGGRQAIFLSSLARWAAITGACRAPPPPAAAGSTATTLSRGDPF